MTRVSSCVATMVLMACTSGSGAPLQPLKDSGGELVEGDYPEGPKGTQIGSTIENYVFRGYVNPRLGLGEANQRDIKLGDFYNPTGEATYGTEGLREEGAPLPTALFINVSAVWCGPCKEEGQTTLPETYAELAPAGLELLMVLSDSAAVGAPADFSDLDNWCTAFDVGYPAVIDPAIQLGGLFDQSQYPANMIIDTRTMSIVEVVSGIPGDSFHTKLVRTLESDGG